MTTYTIATDLSRHSRRAAHVAAQLARRTHAVTDYFCALRRDALEDLRVDPSHVRELLQALAAREGEGVRATAHVAVTGDVPRAIVQRAQDSRASLVVVAPHGVTGWRRVLLGSVARRVLAEATTSVLVARAATESARGPVLAGVDLGPSAGLVLRHAVAIARALGADLDVVHAVPPVEYLLPMIGAVAVAPARLAAPGRELARLVERLPHRGVRIATRAVEGSPPERLIAEARRTDARLVVVGATTKSRVRRAFLGSVAHAVAAVCPVSVLVVRRSGR
jgi:nucleotide-binding universal stress UspA family protein